MASSACHEVILMENSFRFPFGDVPCTWVQIRIAWASAHPWFGLVYVGKGGLLMG